MSRFALVAVIAALHAPAAEANPIVRFATPLGAFDVELCETVSSLCVGAAPNTVANFLHYLDDGDYDGSFVHRSSASVIQGGGHRESGGVISAVPEGAAIASEFNQANHRGALAMARRAAQPDSATNQWFVNVTDNPTLDIVDGGFTVFGHVIGGGMATVDAIHALPRWNFGAQSPFSSLPLAADFDGTLADVPRALIDTQISRVPEPGVLALLGSGLAWLSTWRPANRD